MINEQGEKTTSFMHVCLLSGIISFTLQRMTHRTKGGFGITGINKPRGLLNIIVRRSLLILENVTLTWTNGQEDLKRDP